MNTKVYFPSLNGLRFFAALSVMIYHFYGIDVLNGHLGVVLFFVLSGFLITFLLFEEKENKNAINISSFYWRRILRIWPLYFFIVIIASIVFLEKNSFGNYMNTIPYFILFVPNLAFVLEIPFQFGGILWSVGSEEQFYGFWPWLFKLKTKKNILYSFIIIITLFTLTPHFLDFISHHFFGNNSSLSIISNLIQRMNFGCMAIGGVLAYIARYNKEILKYLFNPFLQWINFSVLIIAWALNVEFIFNDQTYAILFGVLIINLALNPKPIFSLEFRILNFLGKISFGLYVYHLIAMVLTNKVIHNFNIEILIHLEFILALLLTIIFAYVSFILIETPFLRIKKKKFTIVKSN